MLTIVVIIAFISILSGMSISVWLFGTGGKRANIFKDIYFSVEDIDGVGIIYSKSGEYSAVLKIENPVQKYSADIECYYNYTSLLEGVLSTLGEGYALHKQDVFVRKEFHQEVSEKDKKNFLSNAYFKFFKGRSYIASKTYIVITQENKKNALLSYDSSKWRDFCVKIQKVKDQLNDGHVKGEFLDGKECGLYADRFFALNFRDKCISMNNFKIDNEGIGLGDRQCKIYSLLDVDNVGLPGTLRPYIDISVNNAVMPVDLLSEIDKIPDINTVIYNQVVFMPNQKRELAMLDKKKNRHASIPNPNNQLAVEDIKKVQELIAREGKQLVYAHYNLIVVVDKDVDLQKVTNHLENNFAKINIHISKRAYNQLELFIASFPGNCYRLNKDYDRFLTLADSALCLMYKERQAKSEHTPLKCYYTDRQGVPLAIDITGKEGKVKHTNNANFFVLGPSGSGKSFFMNTFCRQLYEQDTDLVIVDTGDSYEGINEYFGGTYISYTKEKPISMNPFKVTKEEYTLNFGEKKNFLKSLIFLIFKGSEAPSKIEDAIINQVIVEYFQEYFHPFTGYTSEERQQLHNQLLLEAKKNGEYELFEEKIQEKNGTSIYDLTDDDRKLMEDKSRAVRQWEKLNNLVEDEAATKGEKANAARQLQRITPMVIETKFLAKIKHDLEKIERQRKALRVNDLNFNSFYEFAVQRIPQIVKQRKVEFPIHDFSTILSPFYRGGELEQTLNNDMDGSLFDDKFIVFEIDKVKDDPILFPIVVLIIMDVFTQKMRIKKGRKCLVIEEAWKAIATPVMAEYIKYLYKTARKHWAMVGVVTQEIQDITSSPIVKEAIINNSDVFMLLDQSKFKDKFSDIKATLALNDIDCKKIFTINKLDNHHGRARFMEVFIKRVDIADVYGVEEPRECYMCYTTEKQEKEALKLYKRLMGVDMQQTLHQYVQDWGRSGIADPLEFARVVLREQRVLNYPEKK